MTDRGGRLVEHEQARALEQRARHAEKLPLPDAERAPALADR